MVYGRPQVIYVYYFRQINGIGLFCPQTTLLGNITIVLKTAKTAAIFLYYSINFLITLL